MTQIKDIGRLPLYPLQNSDANQKLTRRGMTDEHPNLALLSKLDIRDLNASETLFSDDFVWHYFNPKLPDAEGDYVGVNGLRQFFEIIADKTGGTFRVEPISAQSFGEELVVVHVRDTMEFEGTRIALDVAVVWRIVDGKIVEGWDIPSAFTLAA